MSNTAKHALPYPTLSAIPDVPADTSALAIALDSLIAVAVQGTLAARPAFGKSGRFYFATDNSNIYYDTGAAWINMTPVLAPAANSITTAMLQDDAVTAPKIAAGAVGASEVADGSLTATELAAALFPSQGAGAGTEALRALGTAAGQALPGNSFAATPDVCTYVAGPVGNGGTYQVVAPVAGTYIVSFGGGQFNSPGQGSGATITSNKTGTAGAGFSDVGGSGGPVNVPGIVLAVNEVVTFSVAATGTISHVWGRLTRTA